MTMAMQNRTKPHHGMLTPYSALTAGCRTAEAREATVSRAAGGSQIDQNHPPRNPARGCSAPAIHVYQPPADGHCFANWLTETVVTRITRPANRNASGATIPAKLTVAWNTAKIPNAGPIVATPWKTTPVRPRAPRASPGCWRVSRLGAWEPSVDICVLPPFRSCLTLPLCMPDQGDAADQDPCPDPAGPRRGPVRVT